MRFLTSKWTKVVVFLLCLVPLGMLVWRMVHSVLLGQPFYANLTADPIEFIEHWPGDWTLRFIVITLAITPLRKILRLPQLIRFRRMLGLFAFFYVCLHFSYMARPRSVFRLVEHDGRTSRSARTSPSAFSASCC